VEVDLLGVVEVDELPPPPQPANSIAKATATIDATAQSFSLARVDSLLMSHTVPRGA
jgi:hypothetical protein